MIATHTGRRKGQNDRPKDTGDDRCDLCGARIGVEFRKRWRHLRSEHRNYARGLLLRLFAPVVFIALVVGISTLHSSTALLIVALVLCLAVGGTGVVLTREQRSETPEIRRVSRRLRSYAVARSGSCFSRSPSSPCS